MMKKEQKASFRGKRNLKLSYDGPSQRQASGTNQRMKALRHLMSLLMSLKTWTFNVQTQDTRPFPTGHQMFTKPRQIMSN